MKIRFRGAVVTALISLPAGCRSAPGTGILQGTITVFAEDGITPLGPSSVTLNAGISYQLVLQ